MFYKVYYPCNKETVIEADSYELVDEWHRFECYLINRIEPYYRHYDKDIRIERVAST
jgi:hypothetical protein